MKKILIIISIIGLILTLFPSFLFFYRMITWDLYIGLMLYGTILWFTTTPFWMRKEDDNNN